jgi:CubicO group peptidase (beta-lactamase class C family)
MNPLDDAIQDCMQDAIAQKVFPGGVVGYIRNSEIKTLAFGKLTYDDSASFVTTETIYDLASVTKSISTASLILMLADQGKLGLDDRVVRYIPELTSDGGEEIRIRHLLSFTAVFDLQRPLSSYADEGSSAILRRVLTSPLRFPTGTHVLYSDIPYILLGIVAERVSGTPLDVLANTELFRPLNMTHTTFHPADLEDSVIAPTEIVEGKSIKGIVHDEKARAFYNEGLIAGHAGLFSTAGDLLTYCQMILNGGVWHSKRYFTETDLRLMQTEVVHDMDLGYSLGWTTRAAYTESVSVGTLGKTGFTGTLVVVSPQAHSSLVLLTNRTYPHRPESPKAINNVRQKLVHLIFS